METLKAILAGGFVFGIMVLVHELGHFVTAKLNGMHVYQFTIGLGPKIFKYKGKETIYAICLLPVGGMVDLREDENDLTNERSFASKKPYQRLMVILAGAIMNFILAYVFIVSIFLTEPLPTTTVGSLAENMPAVEAGIEEGDTIISINGEEIDYWNDVTKNIAYSDETTFNVIVDRNGEEISYQLFGQESEGFIKIGVGPTFEKNPKLAFSYGLRDFLDKSTMIFDGFIQLITGKISPDQVSGPVGIFKQVGEVAKTNNFKNLMYFTALLSINLGIFNLLPIPFLDGGRAMFIIFEIIFRKPINKDKEAYVHFAGMIALVLLMVVLVFKDLAA
jgi:regulator of sigma E protease